VGLLALKEKKEQREAYTPYLERCESELLGGPYYLAENGEAAKRVPPGEVVFFPSDIQRFARMTDAEIKAYYEERKQ